MSMESWAKREVEINKFFHEMDGKMIEISEAVYYDYKNLAVDK